MSTFEIKRNDTKPFVSATLQDFTGSVVNLTNASSVFFNMSTNDNLFSPIFSGAGTITNAAAGQVQYEWQSSDTNRSGTFLGEFEVTYNDSTITTWPSNHSFIVKIFEDYD